VSTPPKSRILAGLPFLRRDNPWPEFGYGEHAPFDLSLDGNGRSGREIVIEAIKANDVKLMVEVGCFLGGSTLQWLRAFPQLTVIGVDPWEGNWAAYIEMVANHPIQSRSVWHLSDQQIEEIVRRLRRHGNFLTALNNLRLFKERFIPVRRYTPEALQYLFEREIVPELIYIDADKKADDLYVAHKLFPDAILCGDDWLWPDADGVLIMQKHVNEFAAKHGMTVEAKRQTWLLKKPAKSAGEEQPPAPQAAG